MQRIFNKDGFNWWIGVVENRHDPEKLGRCKVRIFGYHTDSKELLPTKDLPWCIPIQPITSVTNGDTGRRVYHVPGDIFLPSITTVMSIVTRDGIAEWRKSVGDEEANRISRYSAGRGTAVHLLCENYLKNKP